MPGFLGVSLNFYFKLFSEPAHKTFIRAPPKRAAIVFVSAAEELYVHTYVCLYLSIPT